MFEDIALVRPTIFAATPRFYGIIYDQYKQMVKELSAKYSLEEARIPVSGVKVCGDGVCVYVCAFMRAYVCVYVCMHVLWEVCICHTVCCCVWEGEGGVKSNLSDENLFCSWRSMVRIRRHGSDVYLGMSPVQNGGSYLMY